MASGRLSSNAGGGAGLGLSDLVVIEERLRAAVTIDEISIVLGLVARNLGFTFHALVHHVDFTRPPDEFLFLQNYPPAWVSAYARSGLYRYDPAQRLAATRPASFAWADLGHVTPLSRDELRLMEAARRAGLGEGFTVPLHALGERAASCSFACEAGACLPVAVLPVAVFTAHTAFAAVFDLLHPDRAGRPIRLTPRQLDCVRLMAQGKSDWEAGQILGLAQSTVTEHLQTARASIGVARRTQLAVAAVSYGLLGFDEIQTWQPLDS